MKDQTSDSNNLQVRRAMVRQFWVRPWLTEERRQHLGQFSSLLDSHLGVQNPVTFQNYTQLTSELFDEVLQRVAPAIEREVTCFCQSLSTGLKLAVTLRYLATGDSYRSLAYAFRCGVSTISKMIPEVCQAILQFYKDEVFNLPITPDAWTVLATQFELKRNIPHAIGALDGKHISIKTPPGSRSLYYNNKGFFSVPLLALVDAEYKFVWIELGEKGHMSDAQIYGDSELFDDLERGALGLPSPCPLTIGPQDHQAIPFFILGDDAFALKKYLTKPYGKRGMSREERILDYRISRGRRVVENAFGILANRFRCLLVEAAIVLHNLLRLRHPAFAAQEVDHEDENHNFIPGTWRDRVEWQDVDQPPAPLTSLQQMRIIRGNY